MYSLLNSTLLLVLLGLSSCSIAHPVGFRPAWTRHGNIVTQQPRINWPQPGRTSQQQPGQHYISRRDGIYSVHNYKQGNLAARWLTQAKGVHVSYPKPGLAHLANYKTPLPGLASIAGVVIDHRLATDLGEQNYKMPRPAMLRGLNEGRVANESTSGKPFESLNRQSPTVMPGIPSLTNPTN